MALFYVKNTAATHGASNACSSPTGALDDNDFTIESEQTTSTHDSFSISLSIAGGDQDNAVQFESGPIGETTWPAGTATLYFDVTTAEGDITIDQVHICRVNSSGVSQGTYGSNTSVNRNLGSTGEITPISVTCSEITGASTSDRVYITVLCTAAGHGGNTAVVNPSTSSGGWVLPFVFPIQASGDADGTSTASASINVGHSATGTAAGTSSAKVEGPETGEVSFRLVEATADTTNATQDITFANWGLTPKAAVVVLSQATNTVAFTNNLNFVVCSFDGTSHACAAIRSANALSTSDTSRNTSTTGLRFSENTTATYDADGAISFIPNGIRITWTTNPLGAYKMKVLLIGGTEVSAKCGQFTTPESSLGTVNVTHASGVSSDFVFLYGNLATGESDGVIAYHHMGVWGGDAGNERSIGREEADNTSTSDIQAQFRETVGAIPTTPEVRINSWTDGFTAVTGIDGNGDDFTFLSLSFGAATVNNAIGTYTTPTSTGNNSITGLGFKPSLVLFGISAIRSSGTEVLNREAEAYGLFTVTADGQIGISVYSEDAVATMNTASRFKTGGVEYQVPADSLTFNANFVSLNNDGITLNHTAVDSAAHYWWYAALDVPKTGGVTVQPGTGPIQASGTADGTSTATGDADQGWDAQGSSAGTSTATGDADKTARPTCAADGTSTATGDADKTAQPTCAADGTSTATGDADKTAQPTCAADGTSLASTGDGGEHVTRGVTCEADGTSTATGDADKTAQPTCAADGTSLAFIGDGGEHVTRGVTCEADGASTAVADPDQGHNAVGSAAGTSNSTASATVNTGGTNFTAIGQADGTSTASAQAKQTFSAVGQADGSGAAFNVDAEIIKFAAGQADGTSTATGDAEKGWDAQGVADGTSTATGDAEKGWDAQGTADGTSTATGDADKTAQPTCAADGTSTATGDADKTAQPTCAADGTSTATGDAEQGWYAQGTADGTSTATASATLSGSVTASGQADGTSTATGDADKTAQPTCEADGTSTATGDAEQGWDAHGSADGTSLASTGDGGEHVTRGVTCEADGTSTASGDAEQGWGALCSADGSSSADADPDQKHTAVGSAGGTSAAAATAQTQGNIQAVGEADGTSTAACSAGVGRDAASSADGTSSATSSATPVRRAIASVFGVATTAAAASVAAFVLNATAAGSSIAWPALATVGRGHSVPAGLTLEEEIVLQKVRIHNALVAAAQAGTFYPGSVDSTTSLITIDETKTTTPKKITVFETQSFWKAATNYKRKLADERSEWRWVMRLQFAENLVSVERFEDSVSANTITLAPESVAPGTSNEGKLSGVIVRLVSAEYTEPPQQAPTRGTQVDLTFSATLRR